MTDHKSILSILVLLLFLSSCQQEYTPKPRGYMRIALPEKAYKQVETDCPYTFETAVYSEYIPDARVLSDSCWFDIYYPQFKARLYFSYKPVSNNLEGYLEDSRDLTNKHLSMASDIEEAIIIKEDTRVFGMLYSVKGAQAASPLQFHLTDSTDHFLRGALYFNVTPNNDSLAPVIEFLEEDVMHLIETLRWRQ